MGEGLRFRAELRHQMAEHVQACLPAEACGVAGGRDGQVEMVLPVVNSLNSAVSFRMDPLEQLKAFQYLEANHLELLAIYHSHPRGPERPSARDIAEYYYPEALMLIWSPDGAEGWQARLFRCDRNHAEEVELIWDDPA